MKQALAIWALSASAVMAQSTVTGSKTMQGNWDASGAAATKPAKSGTSLPAACSTGEFFFNTAAAAGQNIYLCKPDNSWTQVSGGAGGGASSVFGRTGAVAAQSGDYTFSQISGNVAAGQLPAVGGDLSGTTSSATVQAIQGQAVATGSPGTGQVLTWSGTAWGPQNATGAITARAIVFDGSTAIAGETMTAWVCGSGTASVCVTTWTAPSDVSWVVMQIWSAGGSGAGSHVGDSTGGGGGGGGYWTGPCAVTPGGTVTVTVGNGGAGVSGNSSTDGGNSSFGTCATVVGGIGGSGNPAQWGGYLAGTLRMGWLFANGFNTLASNTAAFCSYGGNPGSQTTRLDGGGCGAGIDGSQGNSGTPGGGAIAGGGGGGSGAFDNLNGGAGGVSALGNTLYANGGNGGNGGAWTSGGGVAPCTDGIAPAGGGGSAGVENAGGSNLTGCNGARGEVRIYYLR